jgi:hypothetical protein
VTRDMVMAYSELDDAVNRGDWTKVGVTASFLASSGQSVDTKSLISGQSQSIKSLKSGGSSDQNPKRTTIDAKRAAELDRLVEAGDWQGVIEAATLFDSRPVAASAASKSGSGSDPATLYTNPSGESLDQPSLYTKSSGGGESFDGQATHVSVDSDASSRYADLESLVESVRMTNRSVSFESVSSHSQEGSERQSSKASLMSKRTEYRDEIEALVRLVVPEEIDNIDEMMSQFAGREEELVETLRAMQERAIAQKARHAYNEHTKQADAKPTNTVESVSYLASSGQSVDTKSLLSEQSQSVDSKSLNSGGSFDQNAKKTTIDAKRAAELDRLVEAGDWKAVMEAAQKYDSRPEAASSASKSGSGPSLLTAPSRSSEDGQATHISGESDLSSQYEDYESVISSVKLPKGSSPVGSASKQSGGTSPQSARNDNVERQEITMQYDDLDEAISRGDWATVAILASSGQSVDTKSLLSGQSQSVDTISLKSGGSSVQNSKMTTIDATRAAELDRLVEAGDWSAVMEAAQTYNSRPEASLSASKSGSGPSLYSTRSGESVDGQATHVTFESAASSRFDDLESLVASVELPRDSTAVESESIQEDLETSDNASMARNRAEYREEIESLVGLVVPEEIDNIDEMMVQFAGREEALIVTLRAMQERALAQRTRR